MVPGVDGVDIENAGRHCYYPLLVGRISLIGIMNIIFASERKFNGAYFLFSNILKTERRFSCFDGARREEYLDRRLH